MSRGRAADRGRVTVSDGCREAQCEVGYRIASPRRVQASTPKPAQTRTPRTQTPKQAKNTRLLRPAVDTAFKTVRTAGPF